MKYRMNLLQKLNLNNLLWTILIIHSLIVIVILKEFLTNGKSIHYPITRFQLLIVILTIWFLLYNLAIH